METLRENDFLRKDGEGEDEVVAAHLVCIPISPEVYELTRQQSFYGLPSAGAEGSKTNVDPEHALLSVRSIHYSSCQSHSYI